MHHTWYWIRQARHTHSMKGRKRKKTKKNKKQKTNRKRRRKKALWQWRLLRGTNYFETEWDDVCSTVVNTWYLVDGSLELLAVIYQEIHVCALFARPLPEKNICVWKPPPLMMSALSAVLNGLGRGLDAHFYSYMWQGGASTRYP